MALNHSNDFQSSNQKPSEVELFGTLMSPSFKQTLKSSTMQYSIKHLSQVALKQKIFFYFPIYFYGSILGPPGTGPFWTLGLQFEQT